MTFSKRLKPFLAAAALVVAAGCVGDGDELLTGGFTPDAGQELFTRYVALGNSITAGFQSGGLVPATQRAAYPVLLAERAGVQNFGIPLVATAGCPPPFTAPLTPPASSACAGRNPEYPTFVQNLGVPGARIADLLRIPPGQLGQLNLVLVGPRSQVRAMKEAQPTFVSVWIDPPEEELYLPARPVELGNRESGQAKVVGEERVSPPGFGIPVADAT